MKEKNAQLVTYEIVKDSRGRERWVSVIPSKGFAKKPISLDVLRSNPFFYTFSDDEEKVEDIEDFHIKYKREEVAFRDIIRSNSFSHKKKIALTKKTFKNWEKDARHYRNKSKEKNDAILDSTAPDKPNELPESFVIVLIISFILLLMILGTNSSLWTVLRANSSAFNYFAIGISNGLKQYSLFNIIAHIDFYVMVIWLLYQPYYAYVSTAYRNTYNHTKHQIEKSYNNAGDTLKERVHTAEKYYLKNLRSQKDFAPLAMESVVSSSVSIHELEDLAEQTLTQKAKETKYHKTYHLFQNIFAIASISLFAPTFIFSIVVLIKNLI